jgi:hypothetical protein
MAATKENLVTASWADRSQNLLADADRALLKFFIIKLKDGSFSECSPFLIHKCIQSSIGRVKSIKKLRSGDLLVETDSVSQTITLLDCKTIGHLSVSVTPHNTLNFSKGVISEPELRLISETEILDNLRSQNVCAVRRITVRRDGEFQPTNNIILTFNTPAIPEFITAGYLRCRVRAYIPNPLRCFQCQRFGHSKLSCRGTVTCARCSEVGHDSEKCSRTPLCINCKGDHPSYSRSCPSWLREKEIQTLKTKENISYPEARKIVLSRTPKPGISYAAAAILTKPTRSVGTQTCSINTKNITSTANENETNRKPKSKSKNKTDSETPNLTVHTKSANNKAHNAKPENQPLPKRVKNTNNPNLTTKQLTRKDFLKNRPINLEDDQRDDSLNLFVSPEEEMLTDSCSESDTNVSNTAPV